jgi:hypothetical protein
MSISVQIFTGGPQKSLSLGLNEATSHFAAQEA